MSEYTPGTGRIRDAWRHDRDRYTGVNRPRVYNAEFDRWLVAHDAAIRAEAIAALEAVTDERDDPSNWPDGAPWLTTATVPTENEREWLGCLGHDGGRHYFAFRDILVDGRICIDCGKPETKEVA